MALFGTAVSAQKCIFVTKICTVIIITISREALKILLLVDYHGGLRSNILSSTPFAIFGGQYFLNILNIQ